MSIDLSRPLVSSMGQHDALDGLITYLQLMAAANQQSNTWTEHVDINSVMLATSLGPDGYLLLH